MSTEPRPPRREVHRFDFTGPEAIHETVVDGEVIEEERFQNPVPGQVAAFFDAMAEANREADEGREDTDDPAARAVMTSMDNPSLDDAIDRLFVHLRPHLERLMDPRLTSAVMAIDRIRAGRSSEPEPAPTKITVPPPESWAEGAADLLERALYFRSMSSDDAALVEAAITDHLKSRRRPTR